MFHLNENTHHINQVMSVHEMGYLQTDLIKEGRIHSMKLHVHNFWEWEALIFRILVNFFRQSS